MNSIRLLTTLLGAFMLAGPFGCASHRYSPSERPMTDAEARAYEAEVHEIGETTRAGIRGAAAFALFINVIPFAGSGCRRRHDGT